MTKDDGAGRVLWGDDIPFIVQRKRFSTFFKTRQLHRTENKRSSAKVYISSTAVNEIVKHLCLDLNREHGGLLVGSPYVDRPGSPVYVDIAGAIPAIGAIGTPGRWMLTREAWAYVSEILEGEYSGNIVVGWYHSHPGLGAFFSGTDHFTQSMFYSNKWNVALVYDPCQPRSDFLEAPLSPWYDTAVAWFIGPSGMSLKDVQEYDLKIPPDSATREPAQLIP